ncbi:MAG: hypothetical protein JJE51_02975 [Thermoanaerobaculia bacterium]|nr:hypothetical protein [Thermoanaerobaculia bacterium]
MHPFCQGRAAIAALLILSLFSCANATPGKQRGVRQTRLTDEQLLDLVQQRTFRFFWERANPVNGLVPDRWPSPSFSSVAAVGYGLNAYGIGAERGWVTREAAAARVLLTLRFFLNAPSGPEPSGKTTYKGFVYHFVDMETGARFKDVELSTMDTALLLAGVLFTQSYFDRDNPVEREIRETAETLYRRAEWPFFFERPPLISMAWTPEKGLHDWDYTGYNEAMILYLLALGSPTHPVSQASWKAYTNTYKWETFYGQEHLNFGPLFGHQFAHIWVDFRGIKDEYMRAKGIDYFENSRRATVSQREYAIANPMGWRGYGANIWGLTASDGPLDGFLEIGGKRREFHTYAARAASAHEIRDDGTIAPYGAISSMPFTPEISIAATRAMYEEYGAHIFQQYGFLDAFNPTINFDTPVQMGKVVPGVTWVDGDYLGIDQGPLVAMIENHRSELVWKVMKKNPHIRRGLERAGFTGGWLSQ